MTQIFLYKLSQQHTPQEALGLPGEYESRLDPRVLL